MNRMHWMGAAALALLFTTPASAQFNLDAYGAPTVFKGTNNLQKCPGFTGGDGKRMASWPNGETRYKGKCQGKHMTGKWKAWHDNGKLALKAKLKAGRITAFKSWHKNGKTRAVAKYKNGQRNGTFKAWHSNGKIAAKGKYVDGQRAGCWETWHANGKKASKGSYAFGKKVSTWLTWSRTGTKRKEKLGGATPQGKCLITW